MHEITYIKIDLNTPVYNIKQITKKIDGKVKLLGVIKVGADG